MYCSKRSYLETCLRSLILFAFIIFMLYMTAFRNYGYRFNDYISFFRDKKNYTINGITKAETKVEVVNVSEIKLLVDTDVCKIMDVNPFDDSIKHLLKHPKPMICDEGNLFTYINNNTLYINETTKPKGITYCRVKPIVYKKKKSFIFGKESDKFESSIPIKDEFTKIECFNSSDSIIAENFHMNFVPKIDRRENSRNGSTAPVSGLLNVLLIVLDSTSRTNSLRYMPKTRRFLSETLGAVEMLGYNKVADNTRVNMVPLLTGKFADRQVCLWDKQGVDNCPFIWTNFSLKGHVTHYAEDWSKNAIFHFERPGFKQKPTDYYDYPFHLAKERSEKSKFENCFQGKLSSDVFYNRIYDLALNLGQTPYFSISLVKRYTHDNLSGLVHIDSTTKNTLLKFYDSNLLNNTFLALLGDHGMRYGDVRRTFIGHLEERLPLMFIYVPVWFRMRHKTYFRNLNINSRRLTTHFDMHSTLLHLLDLEREKPEQKHEKGVSLFTEIPKNRSCKDAGILPHWCTCNYHLISKVNTRGSDIMASVLVKHINKLLKKFTTKCETLGLMKLQSTFKLPSHFAGIKLYRIVIITKPGAAVFESTLIYRKMSRTFYVKGYISRLNMYRGQSDCINIERLKQFCFCKK